MNSKFYVKGNIQHTVIGVEIFLSYNLSYNLYIWDISDSLN